MSGVERYDWVDLVGPRDPFDWSRFRPASVTVSLERDWAHGVWSAVASTLAEPLRRALREHCVGCVRCRTWGIAHCFEGRRLFGLLPAGDRVIVG